MAQPLPTYDEIFYVLSDMITEDQAREAVRRLKLVCSPYREPTKQQKIYNAFLAGVPRKDVMEIYNVSTRQQYNTAINRERKKSRGN